MSRIYFFVPKIFAPLKFDLSKKKKKKKKKTKWCTHGPIWLHMWACMSLCQRYASHWSSTYHKKSNLGKLFGMKLLKRLGPYLYRNNIHSVEVNIRLCQPSPRRSRGGHHFRGLTNPDVNLSRMYQSWCTHGPIWLHEWACMSLCQRYWSHWSSTYQKRKKKNLGQLFGMKLFKWLGPYLYRNNIHSVEVNIRLCQPSPKRSRGGHHFRGLTNSDVNLSRMYQSFCYKAIFSCLAAMTKVLLTGSWP